MSYTKEQILTMFTSFTQENREDYAKQIYEIAEHHFTSLEDRPKWVKYKEQKPNKSGYYFLKEAHFKYVFYFDGWDGFFDKPNNYPMEINRDKVEWLSEGQNT